MRLHIARIAYRIAYRLDRVSTGVARGHLDHYHALAGWTKFNFKIHGLATKMPNTDIGCYGFFKPNSKQYGAQNVLATGTCKMLYPGNLALLAAR